MMMPAVDRRFAAIFGLSLAVHALALAWTLGAASRRPVDLPAIVATLRQIAVPQPEVVASPVPAALPPKVRPQAPRAESRPAARAVAAAEPANSPAAATPVAAEASVRPASVAEPTPPPPARPQSEVLAAYRQRLGELFASRQDYPRVAALRGWEGEVRLRLKVARKGNLLGVQIDRSSGFEILDRHALAMLEGLPGLPPLPDALDDNEIQIVVPINYKLRKTT